jgi:zinc transport system ATP-binding protein
VDGHNSIISVENISFRYRDLDVLQDISFAIEAGDFVALIGQNGSGKTTLIRILLGLLPPTAGRVLLMGEELSRFTQWRRIGYVPQKATHLDPLFPASVREVVAMGLLSGKKFPRLRSRRDEEAIDRALAKVDMQALKERRIGELSGGQQHRPRDHQRARSSVPRRADRRGGCRNPGPLLRHARRTEPPGGFDDPADHP